MDDQDFEGIAADKGEETAPDETQQGIDPRFLHNEPKSDEWKYYCCEYVVALFCNHYRRK